jgi:3-methyl-2-oxobutanoate hydroxymethyltransferase
MSAQPDTPTRRPRVTLPRLTEMKQRGEPIVMVTAYDFPSAQVAEEAGVDIVLVGDTAAMVVLGYDATTPVGMDEMVTMAAAVRRGLRTPLLIGDLPFGSYERSRTRSGSSGRPVATRSSSSEGASRWSGRAR